MHNCIQPWKTMDELEQPCTTLQKHVQPCTTTYKLVQPCTTMYNHVRTCTILRTLCNIRQLYTTLYIQTYWLYLSIYYPNIVWILPKYCPKIAQILPNIVNQLCFLQPQNPIWNGLDSLVASLQSWHNPVMWPNTGLWLVQTENDTEGGWTIRGG